jgi:hypothetical protein
MLHEAPEVSVEQVLPLTLKFAGAVTELTVIDEA